MVDMCETTCAPKGMQGWAGKGGTDVSRLPVAGHIAAQLCIECIGQAGPIAGRGAQLPGAGGSGGAQCGACPGLSRSATQSKLNPDNHAARLPRTYALLHSIQTLCSLNRRSQPAQQRPRRHHARSQTVNAAGPVEVCITDGLANCSHQTDERFRWVAAAVARCAGPGPKLTRPWPPAQARCAAPKQQLQDAQRARW